MPTGYDQSSETYCRYCLPLSKPVRVHLVSKESRKHLISKKKKFISRLRAMFVVLVMILSDSLDGSSENCHTCYSLSVRRQQINNKHTYVGVCNGRIRKISLLPYLSFIKSS